MQATEPLAFEMVSAGLHCSFKMSRQMLPWLLTAVRQQRVLRLTQTTRVCMCAHTTDRIEKLNSAEAQARLNSRLTVGVVQLCAELHFRRLEGVVWWEVDAGKEHAARVRRVAGPHDGRLQQK